MKATNPQGRCRFGEYPWYDAPLVEILTKARVSPYWAARCRETLRVHCTINFDHGDGNAKNIRIEKGFPKEGAFYFSTNDGKNYKLQLKNNRWKCEVTK